jgi:cation transport regulator ChaB
MLVKKGTEGLTTSGVKDGYTNDELKSVVQDFKDMMQKFEERTERGTSIRATNFDEEIKHLIPDLSTIFNTSLFEQAERNILSGLGFIDIVQGISSSRRESVLNPKGFIKEVKAGVEDFEQILKELIVLIKDKNTHHPKYVKAEFYINSSPIQGFMTDEFKEKIRQLYDRGVLSKQTAVELIGEVDFRTEIHRREKETEQGLDLTLYPPIKENREEQGIDIPGVKEKQPSDTDEDSLPDDKVDPIEKQNYDIGKVKEEELELAPYTKTQDLPPRVKNNLDSDLQRVFMRVFNNAFSQYKNETRAFRVAWSVIREIGRKGKDGKWHRKRKRSNGKLRKMRLSRAMLEKILDKEEKETIEEALKLKKLEIAEGQKKLLDKLLGNNKEK